MDLSDPTAAVVPSLDGRVLAVLAGTTKPLTGREIQRLAGRGSQHGVQRLLHRMDEHGLVDVVTAGSANLYTLNREHVAAEAVVVLAALRTRLFQRIRENLESWPIRPAAAAVFGSAARGDGTAESDVDVFVVRPDDIDAEDESWSDSVDGLAQAIMRWSGNRASIIQATRGEIQQMVEREAPIVAELRRDAVSLTKDPVLPARPAG
ncbi:nucleotidyltransferase domain-containing protein [Nocardioides sp. NPDC057577]|uniref:nucleotidyltransferase domain-containing protein n=1 Tax=Nocardioides sp. NPDC057577 TaxID=3346171 RepID=UPI00366E0951